MFYLQPVYKVRVVYKSGYVHDFECIDFKVTRDGYSWEVTEYQDRPMFLGVDNIAAVWRIGRRRIIRWKKRK